MVSVPADKSAEREKQLVALSSVGAAIFLTTIKVIVGVMTNSLGMLAEAAHSGLDLVAAGVTLFAVRVSDRPADREHPYGHGKIENFSALIETLLLLITCVWIVYEAIQRLREPVHVEATIWSFIVMGTSIVVDVSRSTALMRTAKKYNSQALEADAVHFSTDVWSSSVVIVGLIAVWLAQWLSINRGIQAEWLLRADSFAALGVSGIVIYVSYQLGRRTVNALLDTASNEMTEQIEQAVRQVPGVSKLERVRLRPSGPSVFVDLTLGVARSASLEEADHIANAVEGTIQQLYPRADVMVHIDPVVRDAQSVVERVWSAAAGQGLTVHSIHAHDVRGHLSLSMHIEVPDDLTVCRAHERATLVETVLRQETPGLDDIVTHIEPVGETEVRRQAVSISSEEVRQAVLALPAQLPDVKDCHHITVYREGGELSVSFHCLMDPNLPISRAHQATAQLENLLRKRLPELGHVVIHLEPVGTSD